MSNSHSDPGPMFPVIGTYVVLAIDPERTLEALDDPEVARVTKDIKPRLFVGYIARVCRLPLFSRLMLLTTAGISLRAFWIISRLSSHFAFIFYARASHRIQQKN